MCLEGDAVFHVVHGTRFGDHRFTGVQFHLDDLHVVAENFIVDFVGFHCGLLYKKLSVSSRN